MRNSIVDPACRIRRKRPSLRLIISSATLDAAFFLDYFNSGNSADESAIVSLEGRMFPVEVAYLNEPTSDYVAEAVKVVWGIHSQVSIEMTFLRHSALAHVVNSNYSKAEVTSLYF